MSTSSEQSAPICGMYAATPVMEFTRPRQEERGRRSSSASVDCVSPRRIGKYSLVYPNIGNDYRSSFSIEASCRKWTYGTQNHKKEIIDALRNYSPCLR